MFAKLVKHEFRATRRIIPFIYLATAMMIMVNLLVREMAADWLSNALMALLFVLGVSEVLMTYVVVFFRYYKNLYNSEGYLMNTLPVPPRLLLTSKILVSFVWLALSYLLMAGVVLTTILTITGESQSGLALGQLIELFIAGSGLARSSFFAVAGLSLLYLILSTLYLMSQVFFAISLGNVSRLQSMGIGAPILIYLGIYLICQLLGLGLMLLVPVGLTIENGVLHLVFESMLATLKNPDRPVIGLGILLLIIGATIGFFAGCARLLKKNVSLR